MAHFDVAWVIENAKRIRHADYVETASRSPKGQFMLRVVLHSERALKCNIPLAPELILREWVRSSVAETANQAYRSWMRLYAKVHDKLDPHAGLSSESARERRRLGMIFRSGVLGIDHVLMTDDAGWKSHYPKMSQWDSFKPVDRADDVWFVYMNHNDRDEVSEWYINWLRKQKATDLDLDPDVRTFGNLSESTVCHATARVPEWDEWLKSRKQQAVKDEQLRERDESSQLLLTSDG